MSNIQEVPMMTPSIVNSTTGGGGQEMYGFGGMGLVGGLLLGSLFTKQNDAVNSIAIGQAQQTGTLTTEIVGLGNNINQGFAGVNAGICANGRTSDAILFNGFNNVNTNMMQEARQTDSNLFNGFANVNAGICNTNVNMATGFANTNFNMAILDKDIQLQNQTNTCNILNAISADGSETRELMNETTIQNLRDALTEERRNNDHHNHSANLNNIQIQLNNLNNNVNNLTPPANNRP
jgi:hypothetical protein